MPDTSARLPRATNDESPSPASWAVVTRTAPTIPDSESSDSRPRRVGTSAKVAWSRTSSSVLMSPRQFGPTSRMPHERAVAQHLGLQRLALGARLGEARREDHDAVHLLATALLHDAGHRGGRHDDDGEVDLLVDVEDAAARPGCSPRAWAFGFTGQTGPAKPARWSWRSTRGPSSSGSRPAPITATLRGERSRRTASAAAVRARASMAASASGVGCRSRRTSTTPSAKRVAVSKPAWVNTPIIRRLSGSTDAVNPLQPHLPGPRREVLEQHRGEPAAVVGVVDEEGHLGLGPVAPAVVAGHTDELVASQRDEGEAVDVVDVGEVLEVALGEARPRAEVAEVDALGRLPVVEGREPRPVVGTDRPHVGGRAVGQHDIGLEGRRVAG